MMVVEISNLSRISLIDGPCLIESRESVVGSVLSIVSLVLWLSISSIMSKVRRSSVATVVFRFIGRRILGSVGEGESGAKEEAEGDDRERLHSEWWRNYGGGAIYTEETGSRWQFFPMSDQLLSKRYIFFKKVVDLINYLYSR